MYRVDTLSESFIERGSGLARPVIVPTDSQIHQDYEKRLQYRLYQQRMIDGQM